MKPALKYYSTRRSAPQASLTGNFMESVTHPVVFVPRLVKQLYEIVAELESLFPGRRFTPDGHLVGSIGEVLAAYHYGLALKKHSTPGHDAVTTSGVSVEVKVTQARSVALREEPVHLIVLSLSKNGEVSEIFNGPGAIAWHAAGKMQKNGQRPISLNKLRSLMLNVSQAVRIPVVRS